MSGPTPSSGRGYAGLSGWVIITQPGKQMFALAGQCLYNASTSDGTA